jgi:hypothetical protein
MDDTTITQSVEQRAFGQYFVVLGEFYNAYTSMEHMLTCAIKNTLSRQMKDDGQEWLVNAIVGSMRMAPAKDTVKRILRVEKADRKKQEALAAAFAQLGDIEWLRNRLAHNRTLLKGDDKRHMFINVDFASAKEEGKSEFVGFQPATIRAASEDLVAITKLTDDIMSMHHGLIPDAPLQLPAWRYKPSLLTRRRPKSGGNRPR